MRNGFKKRLLPLFLVSVLSVNFLLPSSLAQAAGATYYVDQATGNDSDDGLSEADAFLTVQQAANTATAGDTVLIKNGTYREDVDITNSGTSGNLISYENFPGHSPKLSGSDILTDWTSLGDTEAGGLFVSGVEAGDASEFTSTTADSGNAINAQSTVKNNGNYALEATFGGTNKNARANKNFTLNDDVYGRIYFRLNSDFQIASSDQRVELLQLRDTSSINRARVGLAQNSSGDLYLMGRIETPAPASPFYSGTPGEISRDTWHYLELRYKGNSTSGGAEIWLDGVSKASDYSKDTTGLGVSRIEAGVSSSSQSQPNAGSSLYIDDIKASTSPIGAFSPAGDSQTYKRSSVDWTARQVYDNNTPLDAETSLGALGDGEFYMDTTIDSLYIRLEGGENPNSGHTIEVSRRQYVIGAISKSYLKFEGLTLVHNNTSSFGGFDFNDVDNSIITNNTSTNHYGKGVYIDTGSSNNTISNNDFSEVLGKFGGGVRVESDSNNNIIEYNDMSGYNDLLEGASGIQIRSSDNNIVRYNTIHDAWDSGIYITENTTGEDGSDNNQIYGNTIRNIYESQYIGHAGNGIHIAIDSDDNLVYNNLIHDVYGYGIQLRHNANGNKVYNNTIYNTGLGDNGDGIGLILGSTAGATGPLNNTIKNNIVHSANNACFSVDDEAVSAGGNVLDYNVCYNPSGIVAEYNNTNYSTLASYQTASGQDAHSAYGNPGFINAAGKDFRISSSSIAYNTGTSIPEVTVDKNSISRPQNGIYDIGAYETVIATGGSGGQSNETSNTQSSSSTSYTTYSYSDDSSDTQQVPENDTQKTEETQETYDNSYATTKKKTDNPNDYTNLVLGVLFSIIVGGAGLTWLIRIKNRQKIDHYTEV